MNYRATTHAQMVAALAKNGKYILAEATPEKMHLIHMAVGIAGEAGELLDAVKKHVFYDKPLDVPNVIEELGDIEFYLEGLRAALSIDRDRTLVENMAKLGKRYPNYEYTNQRAIERADKDE